MRNFLASIVLAMGLMATPTFATDLPSIAAATYKLYEGDRGICSTTFMRNDKEGALFLTAAHCVDGDNLNLREQQIDQKDLHSVLSEKVFYVKAVRTLKKLDVAILQLRDPLIQITAPQVDVATVEEANTLAFGDKMIVVGYPAAEALSVTEGAFTGTVPVPEPFRTELDAPMYQTTVPVAGGNSGGGLYAQFDGTWKLVGTVTAKRLDNDIMTYYQTADTVNKALLGYMNTSKFEAAPERPSQMGIDQR